MLGRIIFKGFLYKVALKPTYHWTKQGEIAHICRIDGYQANADSCKQGELLQKGAYLLKLAVLLKRLEVDVDGNHWNDR